MSGSYTASASLTVRSNAPDVLAAIARGLGMVDARIKRTERELGGLLSRFTSLGAAQASVTGLGTTMQRLQATTRGTTQAVAAVAGAMSGMATATGGATAAMGAQTAAMGRAATAAQRVAASAQQATAAMRGLGAVPPVRTLAAGGGSGGGGGTRDSRLGEMVAAGAAGRGIMRGLFVAGSLQHEEAILRAQTRPTDARFRERVMQRAIEMTGTVRGTTVQQNYALINELRTVLGGQEEALHFAPQFGTIAAGLHALTGRPAEDVVGGLGRAMTLRGSFVNPRTGEFDSERGMREVELAGRMLMAFRDRRMSPDAFLAFQKQARVAGAQLSPDAYFGGYVASGIQAMGGHRFGTASAAMYRQMVTGIMTEAQAREMRRFNLMDPNARGTRLSEADIRRLEASGALDAEEAAAMRQGGAMRFGRRAIRGAALFPVDPDAWRQHVTPFMDQALRGMLGRAPTHQDRIGAMASIGATEVSRGGLQWLFNPAERAPDIEAVRSVQGGAFQRLLTESFNVALDNMTSGFTNMVTAIGQAATPDLIAAMNTMADAMNRMAQWARDNPETARIIGDVAAALSVLAIAGAAFAAGSLAIGGLTALASAIGTGAGLAGVVGSAAFTAMVAPGVGLAALAAGVAYLAFTMEGKDWKALFDGLGKGISDLWDLVRRQAGMGEQPAVGAPVVPGVGPLAPPVAPAPPNVVPRLSPFGTTPGVPGMPGRRSSLDDGGWNLASFVPPPVSRETVIPVTLAVDGRRLTEVVVRHLERDASGPTTAAARFDGRMALAGVDMG